MTGFGKSNLELSGKKISIEIRSLNSKQLDLNLRVPSSYREKESEIRGEISRTVERGKVDFSIYIEYTADSGLASINKDLAKAYYRELKSLAEELNEKTDCLSLTLRIPEVLRSEKQELDENEWKSIQKGMQEAIAAFNRFREDEGKVLAKEFIKRIEIIASLLEEVKKMDPQRILGIKERILKNLAELGEKDKVDTNRFEQELIYYIEKLDITEEKLRLKTHCDYFLTTLKEASSGRKLGFISQEIGREINTIGSKANDAGIQKLVVQMKDELEKIKEQLLNVL